VVVALVHLLLDGLFGLAVAARLVGERGGAADQDDPAIRTPPIIAPARLVTSICMLSLSSVWVVGMPDGRRGRSTPLAFPSRVDRPRLHSGFDRAPCSGTRHRFD
jgi:hypothetical protein